MNNSGGESWSCNCGAERCRGLTGASFFTLSPEQQQEYLTLLADWFVARHPERIQALNHQI